MGTISFSKSFIIESTMFRVMAEWPRILALQRIAVMALAHALGML
jgi:hypothetical protein